MLKFQKCFIGLVLNLMILLSSCSKENPISNVSWNALSFTESENSDYFSYMNQPHINLTFPGIMTTRDITFEKGILILDSRYYSITGHNWDEKSIVLIIQKDGVEFKRLNLTPEVPEGADNAEIPGIRTFSLSVTLPKGDYTFEASVREDSGNERLLKTHILHNTQNRLKVL
ncbi:MAG: hypothetical protein A2X19_05940 [Bacteroidetes bacterium GWE2_39_28]|nr:MAG: hypothetical protein A2X19_05940 [Bacteroidetes bacterium GWE2_39_28]OFY12786.1 MAG: hypothetical protein A2X16_00720 [Bacteroidetes bacterium GWF2_39_10]OFZ07990.1 MAG: hypothetical protein A2322_07750 [Bacteroidetes bacterium RIFOXYB2_FULL_39_7]OFZ11011.1 MAG: hypothetical protein A2465_00750 [Bacteroidetes bacterium RIFOXYC2_FULL_39_11]HCT93738.1 hypothetical protein [Rikenellaceae bacterium]